MSTAMSDQQLASRVARELSSPEPSVHFGATLVAGTLIASPVLVAAAAGRHDIPTALAIYAGTLVVVWVLAGLVFGGLALASSGIGPDEGADPSGGGVEPRAGSTRGAETPPSTPADLDSIGSDGAHRV
jgi:hypothetical protein